MKLTNKVAIVTGGARGIGAAIASLFAKEGASVVIVSRTKREVDSRVGQISHSGGGALGIVGDVSKISDARRIVSRTLKRFSIIDILVNCAGIQKPIGPFCDTDVDKWAENIGINLIGTVNCCRAVLPVMIEKKKGKILNFSGGGATSPRPNFSAYACAKAAVVRFTETLALEVKEYNIDVNAISPGAVNTRMTEEIIEAGWLAGRELVDAQKRKEQGATSPALAAELAVFLASCDSDGLTGKLISAVWDDWKGFGKNIKELTKSNLYTIRRIDDRNFFEKK